LLDFSTFIPSRRPAGSNPVDRLQLQADNLFIERGTRAVIAGLSFAVKGGEALLLMGPNGSGKTTLIRTLAGFITPSSGQIRIADADQDDRDLAELCHYVGHLTGVKANLTAEQNLTFWARYLGEPVEHGALATRVSAALADFGLAPLADYPAGLLSAGQKRRLGLARLRVATRPIWLLDEPTVSLDAASAGLLARLIQQHVAGGGLVVAATHLPLGLDNPTVLLLPAGGAGTSARDPSAGAGA
jgi:heme exporter protein A